MRLVGRPLDVYQYLEPLYNDYRKVRGSGRAPGEGGQGCVPLLDSAVQSPKESERRSRGLGAGMGRVVKAADGPGGAQCESEGG